MIFIYVQTDICTLNLKLFLCFLSRLNKQKPQKFIVRSLHVRFQKSQRVYLLKRFVWSSYGTALWGIRKLNFIHQKNWTMKRRYRETESKETSLRSHLSYALFRHFFFLTQLKFRIRNFHEFAQNPFSINKENGRSNER